MFGFLWSKHCGHNYGTIDSYLVKKEHERYICSGWACEKCGFVYAHHCVKADSEHAPKHFQKKVLDRADNHTINPWY